MASGDWLQGASLRQVRYMGLSNESPWGVMEFARLANVHALSTPVSIQNSYSLINRVDYETHLGASAY